MRMRPYHLTGAAARLLVRLREDPTVRLMTLRNGPAGEEWAARLRHPAVGGEGELVHIGLARAVISRGFVQKKSALTDPYVRKDGQPPLVRTYYALSELGARVIAKGPRASTSNEEATHAP